MKRALGWLVLLVTGWRPVGPFPETRRFVMIAAPHTTNWDFLYVHALTWAIGRPISWIGKHSLFWGPLAPVMRALGGFPVRRDRRNDLVKAMAEEFEKRDDFVLVVPAEATRSRTEHWKSGFYRIAETAHVPVHLGYLDYPSKTGGFGIAVELTGDVGADMDRIRAFYADKVGKHPENFGPIRLLEEVPDLASSTVPGGDSGRPSP